MTIAQRTLRPLSVALLTGVLGIPAPALGQGSSVERITSLTPLTAPEFVSASDFGLQSFQWGETAPQEGADRDQTSAAPAPSLRLDFAPAAPIWAGLPTTAGRSHYEGYAVNTAHMAPPKWQAPSLRRRRSVGLDASARQAIVAGVLALGYCGFKQ
ncbi:hypothetical protein FHS89_000534 [Rubricella aquisinus]|uniref:Uncharacterized protein n=1 Tax=Rubricella aquisinus TaxID=2028108 RepID=A0A840WXY5_9RHOB|nr:hypothetical protein [Rubricella aquisinus]MBB5514536.1 hypothetical protein [Rubricella aquisinus]